MRWLTNMMRNQFGRLSVARVATVVAFAGWLVTWGYTLYFGRSYAHFDTITIAVLVLFFVVLLGKSVDSKIISIKSSGGERDAKGN